MAIKDFWNRLFNKKNSNIATAEEPETPKAQEDYTVTIASFDYELGILAFALRTGDYGWTEPKPFKKVTLVNVRDCENKITVMGMVSAWRGTGHSEWEFILGGWFVGAVVNALNNGCDEADISRLFDRDLLARNGRVFTQEQIFEHLIPWFEVIEESVGELKLKLKIG